jgi:mercuric ion transport protein
MSSSGSVRLLTGSAAASAVAASICCVGPLALAVLGLGGGAFLLPLAPYRPYLLGASTLLLGAAYYLTYRRRPVEDCVPGSACARPSIRRGQKVALWIVTILVALAIAFPHLSEALF